MTTPIRMNRGLLLRAYLGFSYLLTPLAKIVLRRRLRRGKEHPVRWQEKCGRNLAPRPKGKLIWFHAVGLGEVLSLRGLILRLSEQRQDLSFLVTSTTRASAEVFEKNAPPRTIHQFLPIDAPSFRRRFLSHCKPDLCVWVEQDIWPGFVSDMADAGIPQCLVAARMNTRSAKSHDRARQLFRDIYGAMEFVTAQDDVTERSLASFGVTAKITGSLKPTAPPLSSEEAAFTALKQAIGKRFAWAVAPAHPEDILIAEQAHEELRKKHPDALLIIAPRFIKTVAARQDPRWSEGEFPRPENPIWLCDTLGDMGIVYRCVKAALIGGTFSEIEGHNPWEAAALDCPTLHGPRTGNFKSDFATLDAASASIPVLTSTDISIALQSTDLAATAKNASACIEDARTQTNALATRLIELLEKPHAI